MFSIKHSIGIGIGIASVFVLALLCQHKMWQQAVVNDVNSNRHEKDSFTPVLVSDEITPDSTRITRQENNIISNATLEVVSHSYTTASNEKCAWGFVRKPNGASPEFYGPHAKVLDANEGIYKGNPEEPVLYLTFDEGYENGYTASILDTLKEKEVTAAFFVTMPYVKQNPELIQRMIDEGHIVGNHTVNHPSMPEVTDNEKLTKEVMDLHHYLVDNFHYEMHYLRPPKGEYSERTVKLCLDLGYRHVLWSSAYADWDPNNQKGNDYAKKMICNNFHNGGVMLLHAVSKDNAAVLRRNHRRGTKSWLYIFIVGGI